MITSNIGCSSFSAAVKLSKFCIFIAIYSSYQILASRANTNLNIYATNPNPYAPNPNTNLKPHAPNPNHNPNSHAPNPSPNPKQTTCINKKSRNWVKLQNFASFAAAAKFANLIFRKYWETKNREFAKILRKIMSFASAAKFAKFFFRKYWETKNREVAKILRNFASFAAAAKFAKVGYRIKQVNENCEIARAAAKHLYNPAPLCGIFSTFLLLSLCCREFSLLSKGM